MNLRVMQMLDEGHCERFGEPSPRLREHQYLAGHFGGAWQKQKVEFSRFTGPVLATTNCVLIPWDAYRDRLFTTRVTTVPGGKRLLTNDYSEVIECAKQCEPLKDEMVGESTIGYHHGAILGVADKIVEAVKAGDLKHFFLIGGCDGAEPGRNWYSQFAQGAPPEYVILTLGCGKYRIRNHDYGTVAGLPRLLDMGQCNDAYGAIQVAVELASAFDCEVNDLPLTIVLSWFEQKAVAVLLTLLYLGIKGIRIGPAKPAFLSDNVMQILRDKYELQLIDGNPLVQIQNIVA